MKLNILVIEIINEINIITHIPFSEGMIFFFFHI